LQHGYGGQFMPGGAAAARPAIMTLGIAAASSPFASYNAALPSAEQVRCLSRMAAWQPLQKLGLHLQCLQNLGLASSVIRTQLPSPWKACMHACGLQVRQHRHWFNPKTFIQCECICLYD